jgi:acyl-CoA synthetase (AMP-forming)/AMP-acid ligase II
MHAAAGQPLWYGMSETSVLTAFLPLFHVAGTPFAMAAGLFAAASPVLMTRWVRALVPALPARHGLTPWSVAPTMVADATAAPEFGAGCLATFRCLAGGGSSIARAAGVSGRIAHHRFGLALIEGLKAGPGVFEGSVIARPGRTDVPIHAPLLPGDRVQLERERPTSRPSSRPGRGIATERGRLLRAEGSV